MANESNSSKTAHVLNLLNRNHGAAPADKPAEAAEPVAEAAEPVAEAAEPVAEAAEPVAEAAEPFAQLEQSELSPEGPFSPLAEKGKPSQGPFAQLVPEGADIPEPIIVEAPSPDYETINVMEILVERLTDSYMEKFGMCTCSRCRADVMSLALTRLPNRYMVMDQTMISPWLSMCEKKYSAEITMELMKACQVVKDNPRHNL